MNLVIGATGMVGTEVCRALVEAGKSATAVVRPSADPVKAARTYAGKVVYGVTKPLERESA